MNGADPSAGKRDGECAWLSEDVASDIHQPFENGVEGGVGWGEGDGRGWGQEIQSFLRASPPLVGNLAELFCAFPQIPSYRFFHGASVGCGKNGHENNNGSPAARGSCTYLPTYGGSKASYPCLWHGSNSATWVS